VDPAAQPLDRAPQRALPVDTCTGRTAQKPLLLVDIDGVLSLFGFPPHAPPEGSLHFVDGIPHFLSSTAARHLLALVSLFELVWCSGWEERADEYLPALLGLPRGLPHLSFERAATPTTDGHDHAGGEAVESGAGSGGDAGTLHGHWKLAAIDAYASVRPLAWIDDCLDDACRAWAAAREAPTLLVQTSPERGLTEWEAARLRAWAETLAA
jgi:HAD domain in Swiss Army Knife RNA repair proteins